MNKNIQREIKNEGVCNLTITDGIKPEVGITNDGILAKIVTSESDLHYKMITYFPMSVGNFLVNSANWNSIFKTAITGTLEDNTKVLLMNPIVTGINLNLGSQSSDIIVVESLISDVYWDTVPDSNQTENRQWRVRLSNLKLQRGDVKSLIPAPTNFALTDEQKNNLRQGIDMYYSTVTDKKDTKDDLNDFQMSNGFKSDKIVYRWASREWELTDDKSGKWGTNYDDISVPIISGSLTTPYQQNDTECSITELAEELALLLSFALGRDIKPCGIELQENQQVLFSHRFYSPVNPFNDKGEKLIDNGDVRWQAGNIKQFIESAEIEFNNDKEWWKRTLGLFVQGTSCFNVIEIQLATLNILLDRISSHLVQKQGKIIDENIDKRIKHPIFRCFFHKLLKTFISKKWTKKNSESLLYKIKEFNDDYSFPNKVIAACEVLNIVAMPKSHISFRHKLLHLGDFDKKLQNMESKVNYLVEIRSLLALMILKKFDFKGQVYLRYYNATEPQMIEDITDILVGDDGTV
jgi:hypothetical protein